MARLVIPKHPTLGQFASKTIQDQAGDDYRDRLVKYIPAESVALYAFTDKLLNAYYGLDAAGMATKAPADWLLAVGPWALFLLGLIGTPIYLSKQRIADQPWRLHAAIATLAFVLWAYTLGGSLFIINHWYHVLLAGLLAPIFTFVAGLLEPKG